MNTSSTATLDLSNVETDELVIAPSDGQVDEIIEWQPSPMPQSFLSSSGISGHTDVEDVTIGNIDTSELELENIDIHDLGEGRRRKTRPRKPRTKRHYKKRRSHKKRTYKRRCKCSKKRRSPRRKYTRRK